MKKKNVAVVTSYTSVFGRIRWWFQHLVINFRPSWAQKRGEMSVCCLRSTVLSFTPSVILTVSCEADYITLANPIRMRIRTHSCWAATGQSVVMLNTAALPINSLNLRDHAICTQHGLHETNRYVTVLFTHSVLRQQSNTHLTCCIWEKKTYLF